MRFDRVFGLTSMDYLASFVTGSHYDGESFIVDFRSDASITLGDVQPDQINWNDVSMLS